MSEQPYQLLPPLSDDEYAALREDITANGIRVPVDVDEDGQILDGHHRVAIAAELGVAYPTRVVAGLTEDEKRHHALAVNLQRRQLSREQRRGLVADELARDPSRSDRAIARIVGVSHHTVAAIRNGGWAIAHHGEEGPPRITRAEAERRTERIRHDLAMCDLRCMLALVKGAPPADIVRAVQPPADFCSGDGEAREAWWQAIVRPRIDGAYAWPNGGVYRWWGLQVLTWPEWDPAGHDPALAAEAERLLRAEFPKSASDGAS